MSPAPAGAVDDERASRLTLTTRSIGTTNERPRRTSAGCANRLVVVPSRRLVGVGDTTAVTEEGKRVAKLARIDPIESRVESRLALRPTIPA
jgi:hypothetical protein